MGWLEGGEVWGYKEEPYGAETLNTATFVQWPIWWRNFFEF